MTRVPSWLKDYFGPTAFWLNGVLSDVVPRETVNFVTENGITLVIEDDPDNNVTRFVLGFDSGELELEVDLSEITGLGPNVAAFLADPTGAKLATALTTALPLSKGGTGLTAVPGADTQVLMNASSAYGAAANVTYVGGFLVVATDLKLANSGFEMRLSPGTLGSSFTVTLPGQSTTLVGRTTSDTLTNKSISFGSNTVTFTSAQLATACSDETGSGVLVFNNTPTLITPKISDSSGGQFYNVAVSDLAADRTITLPLLAGNDVFVFADFIQTLTNKTLTSPTIGGTPVISATSMSATGNARCKLYSDIASVNTTDATVTSLFTWTILDEAATGVTAEVLADQSTGANTAWYVRRARIKRDGGTATVGTVEDSYTSEEVAGWDCTIDNSTSTGRIRVTGAAATNIDWGGVISRIEVNHA